MAPAMAERTRLKTGRVTWNCSLSAAATSGWVIAPAYGMMSSLGSGMHALSMPMSKAMPGYPSVPMR